MNENDKDLLNGIGADEPAGDTMTENDDILINGLFAEDKSTAAPGAAAPAPRTGAPAPRTAAPAPRTGAPAPRTGAPAPRTAAPAPRTGAPAPRTGAPAPRTGGPAPRTGGPAPRTGAPAPGTIARRTDARYQLRADEIKTLAAAAESALANGRYAAALDSVFFTAGKAREDLEKAMNIRVPIGSRAEDLPGIAAAALITCYLKSEKVEKAAILEQLRLIIESSEDENGARPSAGQVELRVFECVLILCVQAEQSGKHPGLKDSLYRNEDSFLRSYLDESFDGIFSSHRGDVETFFSSVRLQSSEVAEIFGAYIEEAAAAAGGFFKRFFAETRPVMITSIVAGCVLLISSVLYFIFGSSFFSSELVGFMTAGTTSDPVITALIIVFEVLLCGAFTGTAWLIYNSGEAAEDSSDEE